jgi:hypothetical protein
MTERTIGPHTLTVSERKELEGLVRDYVSGCRGVSRAEMAEGVLNISLLYEETLTMRYAVPRANIC